MKIYRTIGTILSSLFMLILVIVLTASLLILSAARAVSKDTISNITKTVLSNEDVQAEISSEISSALTDMLQNIVSTKPSQPPTQNQNQNQNQNSTPQNPSQSTGNTTNGNENTEQSPETVIQVTEEKITEILNMPEVQDTLSDIVSDYAMAIIEQKENHNISCSQSIEDMLAENPEAFNIQIEDIIKECNLTYDDFYDIAKELAEQNDFAIPEKGASYTAVAIAILGHKSEEIDALIEGVIEQFLPASDSADQIYAIHTMPVLTAVPSITAPSETEIDEAQSTLETISSVLTILKNPRIYAALLSLLLVFFLITALFTWSFKRPLLLIGIAAILTGILLIGVANLPIPYDALAELTAEIIMPDSDSLESTMRDVIITTWDSAASIITTHAIVSVLIGILCCTSFALIGIFTKKKVQQTAEASATT
ncbi:MAG: hypothetical protein IJ489_06800 [Clostridia bacterium]|nr:hypothetical protein [Clostridia bacterium]